MRVSSAKSKGRRLQQYVCKELLRIGVNLEEDDIRSTSMGAGGEDVLFSPMARRQYPFSIECKNVEKLSIWSAIKQARENCKPEHTPMVIFNRNHEDAHVAMPFEKFLEIYKVYLEKTNDEENS